MIRITIAFALAAGTAASAGVAPFEIFENADGASLAGLDFGASIADGGSYAEFTVFNNAADGVVTRIVVENTAATSQLGAFSLTGGLGDDWSSSASGSVPGSIAGHSGPWQGTLRNLTADPSPVANGIDVGESLAFRFDLGSTTFDAVNNAFIAGEFRFVAHIQSIGDSSVWGVTTAVPTPAAAALMGLAGLTAARRRR